MNPLGKATRGPGGGPLTFPLVCALFSLLFLAKDGSIRTYDTIGYLYHWILARPPIYPLMLDAFQLAFGRRYAVCLCIFQIILVLGAALHLTSVLSRRYEPGGWIIAACFLILISPLYNPLRIGNLMQTQALAYGLFLISAALAAEAAHSFDDRPLLALAAVTVFNTLVRSQMVFMIPAFFLLVFCNWFKTRLLRQVIRPMAFMILAGFAALLFEYGYNLHYNGFFTGSRAVALLFARDALYVSDSQDLALFKDTAYYPAMQRIFAEMDGGKLFSKYRHEHDANLGRYCASAADPRLPNTKRSEVIFWGVLSRHLYRYFAEGRVDGEDWLQAAPAWGATPSCYTNAGAWLKVDAACRDIFLRLFRRHKADYLKLPLSRLKNEVGVVEAMLLLFLLILPFAHGTELNIFVAFATLAGLVSLLAIVATNSVFPGYTFFTDDLQAVALLLWFQRCWRAHAGSGMDRMIAEDSGPVN
jgi:hypothetical protein